MTFTGLLKEFKNPTLLKKILIAIMLFIFMLFIQGFYGLTKVREMGTLSADIYKKNFLPADEIKEAYGKLTDTRILLFQLIYSQNEKSLAGYEEKLINNYNAIDLFIKNKESLYLSQKEREILDQAAARLTVLKESDKKVIELRRGFEEDEAVIVLNMECRPLFDNIRYLLQSLIDIKIAASKSNYKGSIKINEQTFNNQLIIFLISLLVSVLILIGARYSTRPLKDLLGSLTDIAEGGGDLSKRLTCSSTDEIGELVGEFNKFTESLRDMVKKIYEVTKEVNMHTSDISAAVEEQAAIALEQSGSVAEITATMEELSTTSTQIAENSSSVVKVSTGAYEKAKNSVKAGEALVDKMSAIFEDNQNNITEISDLAKKAREISKIMEIINGIANHTKLIAFNAALEASSAGESGKRFSIVADEIRRLADSVMESTGDIEGKISEIQEAANRLSIVSEQGSHGIKEGKEFSLNSLELFKEILNSTQATTDSAKQISLSTNQQKTASNQVVTALKEINEGTSQSSTAMNQITDITGELQSLVDNLESLVEKFNIDDAVDASTVPENDQQE